MLKKQISQNKLTKKILKEPLYKPLKIQNTMDLDFNDALINTCNLIHKSMMALVRINTEQIKNPVPLDDLCNENADYLSAVLLHMYFTQWLLDVEKMQKLTEGGE